MSLVQTYRAELAERQNRRFLAYLALALGIHVAAASLLIGLPRRLNPQASEPPLPLEFVAIQPQQTAPSPQPQRRQAQANSTAGGTRDPNRPVQSAPRPNSRPNSTPSSSSAAPAPPAAIAPPRQAASEQAAIEQIAPEQATSRQPAPESVAPSRSSSAPVAQSLGAVPLSASPSAQPRTTAVPNSSPSRSAAASAGAAPSLAAGLGNHSVSVESGSQPLNPDRTAAGSGVDAVRNDLWGGYLAALNRTVEQNWRQVSVAATSRTRVQFRVNRQGQVTSLQLLEASGNPLADQAAIQAVRAAAPFAPLPQEATEETLIVNFTFTQWLKSDAP